MIKLKSLIENYGESTYSLEYHDSESGNGIIDSDNEFKKLINRGLQWKKKQIEKGNFENILYLGVIGNGDDFSIIHVTEDYIRNILNSLDFNSIKDYRIFLKACKDCLSQNKTIVGSFEIDGNKK